MGSKEESGFRHLQADGKGNGLNPHRAVEAYFDKILSGIGGMKVLLLDKETITIASLATSQTKIQAKEVFLTQRLADFDKRETMMHLKGVVLCRPTYNNVQAIRQELRKPKYGEYHVFFTNVVRQDLLQQLAEADERELIKQVQEFYADFYPVTDSLFSLNVRDSMMLSVPRNRWGQVENHCFFRSVEGVAAALLAFKKSPAIRYLRTSELGKHLAMQVRKFMEREKQLFHFPEDTAGGGSSNSLLLVLDRRDDPVTPLLTQWTYQAMVHELLGIKDNTVDLSKAPNVQADLHHVVLGLGDEFFVKHMFSNFGDLGDAVKELLVAYQKQTHSNKQIESIEDMQRFVESYPQFKQFATNVSKHVAVVGELARMVAVHKLLDMSELEQEMACSGDHATQVEAVKRKIMSPYTSGRDAVRMAMLYALRYEQSSANQLSQLKRLLRDKGVPEAELQQIDHLLAYAGSARRGADLFGESTLLSKSLKMATRAVKGVQNVYTQHKPLLHDTLEQLQKGKLKESLYPFVGPGNARDRPKDVIVFIAGGATFEEAAAVHRINQANLGINVVLGGSSVHSSRTFMEELSKLGAGNTATFPQASFNANKPF